MVLSNYHNIVCRAGDRPNFFFHFLLPHLFCVGIVQWQQLLANHWLVGTGRSPQFTTPHPVDLTTNRLTSVSTQFKFGNGHYLTSFGGFEVYYNVFLFHLNHKSSRNHLFIIIKSNQRNEDDYDDRKTKLTK